MPGYDVCVIGSGVSGLVAAGLLARSGRRVVLLESHDKPGGSAGYYEAAGFTFDAGATTLVGFGPGDPLTAVCEALGLSLPRDPSPRLRTSGALEVEPVDGVSVNLPDRSFFFGRGSLDLESTFPGSARFFARLAADGDRLWNLARRWPVLPITSPLDLLRDLRLAHPSVLPLLASWDATVADVERHTRAPRTDPGFRSFVDLALLVSVQSPSYDAPWWNGALGVDLFRRGVSRARGGMKSFVEALLSRFRAAGGEVRFETRVTSLRRDGPEWLLRTATAEEFRARHVVANVPLDSIPPLLGADSPAGRKARSDAARCGPGWGALTLNLGLSRVVHADASRLHHLVKPEDADAASGEGLFVSFSPPGDPVAGPGRQTVSISTHTEVEPWAIGGEAYHQAKERARERLLGPVARLFPGLSGAIAYEDLGTPRTFRRYTRREGGRVGGFRMTRGNSFFRAPDPTLGLPGFQLVGDSTFPGQGTLAVAMSGALAAERLGAVTLLPGGGIAFRQKSPGALAGAFPRTAL